MTRAFVALGSNLQDPAQQIRAAFAALALLPATRLLQTSALYRTAPVGYLDQPDFINAVAELDTELTPLDLLHALLDIEAGFGRVRSFRNAPRILDLDLLWMAGTTLETTELTLPHPRMHERAFVLLPLAELAADLSLGAHGLVGELAARLVPEGIERLPADDNERPE
ncbi:MULTISPECIES: 2-amino-4-hydroxy-6-hydroxymethyldihydropteridine diphosphokinase [unclassified Paludibacterium]|uniref:2-amino-4-hydroxy-6- hydroxymethyldihydropteridine diphosphokinase n=1 Tax=unclassified Paludibacterium TaxID=2618429 RepID=UPI001C04A563|nr:2-amino-4-hydroxy-6-hydroxymethyldihydropteridine diphosphokinase [Paludibacterium sp. B53371]BEV70545.1 2-amino-4-hydroxy-6-hydroxymethyldihydropteridine diphosphokinase [Paludibacterium sp. THUN1379]